MNAALALLALAFAQQAPAPTAETYTTRLAGKDVRWSLKPAPVPEYPADVLAWDGWSFLPREGRTAPDLFLQTRLPEDLADKYAAVRAKLTEQTPAWDIKVVLLTHTDIRDKGDDGVIRSRRSSVEDFEVQQILPAVARFAAAVETAADGAIRVVPHVEIHEEYVVQERQPGKRLFGDDFLQSYLGPRLNGPGFEADDRAYRGPYEGVFLIHPGLAANPVAQTMIGGMPVESIPTAGFLNLPGPGGLEAPLLYAWTRQAAQLARSNGFSERAVPGGEDLALLAGANLDAEQQTRLMTSGGGALQGLEADFFVQSSTSDNVSLSLVADPARGTVLNYREFSITRRGGAVAPTVSGEALDISKHPFLSFWAKSSSMDPVAVTLWSGETPVLDLTLGDLNPPRDAEEKETAERAGVALDFTADGTWHQVVVDLREHLPNWQEMPVVTAITIGPPLNSTRYDKRTVGRIEYQFDDFEAAAAAPAALTALRKPATPDFNSPREEDRSMALAQLNGQSDKEALEAAVKALQDPDETVRLNAAEAFSRVKYEPAVPALISTIRNISPRVSKAVVRALAFQDTEQAWSAIRQAIASGPYDDTRQEAATQIGSKRDPLTAGILSTVIATRSRDAKLAAIDALGQLPGERTQQVLLVFLNQEDPAIRLRVTQNADASIPLVRRQLLYSAVNDFSDAVRSASYIKLLRSGDPEMKKEAYKGVRDEGVLVRLAVLDELASNPHEDHRGALRVAVVDQNPQVRAAALRVFGKLEKGVSLEEIQNTLSDSHPLVQMALLELAQAKKITLPKATLETLRSSPIRKISEPAASLNEA